MSLGSAAAGSVVVGVVLALVAIFGGVSAVSSGSNPASASDQLVRYDAP